VQSKSFDYWVKDSKFLQLGELLFLINEAKNEKNGFLEIF
jgi:hypothetical protein